VPAPSSSRSPWARASSARRWAARYRRSLGRLRRS